MKDSGNTSKEKPMRIWYQLLASNARSVENIASVQRLCDQIASPGTTVEVHGSDPGSHDWDKYSFFQNFQVPVVLKNALKVRKHGGYDAFVMGNSLDPGLIGLRELLDIPVLSVMEVCCHTACTLGEKFGVVTPNVKFNAKFRDIVAGYGLQQRCVGVAELRVHKRISELKTMFVDKSFADETVEDFIRAGRILIEQGAEVLIPTGPTNSLLAHRKVHEVDGALVMDGYSLAVKAAEAMVAMHRLTGMCVSRKGRYASPPADLLQKGAELHGFGDLL